MSTGVLAAMIQVNQYPAHVVFPDDWHLHIIGRTKKITKEEVIERVADTWPDFPWPKNKGEHEHVADAICTLAYVMSGRSLQ
jgi:hypothetical protein